ncbi:MAG TPA: DUF1841 family protein [Candidatus Aerophobetes bacterium]|uniref:DUF1841 family protein n=1 Tax=Aerophobetes bacterium TaxID=2030807 RepID=A0A662DIU1_UNCAE|nr:MAG: hypothetical protein DRI96_00890 [Candidatus Aerophobetes bacterium]HDN84419.1 DUF1841 family protein [Candidatus Aerophobetes bacterium]
MISEDEAFEKALRMHPQYMNVPEGQEKVDGVNPHLHLYIHAVIERQLTSDEFPVVKEVFIELMKKGLTRHQVIHIIGKPLARQIYYMLKENKPFNSEIYEKDLLEIKDQF